MKFILSALTVCFALNSLAAEKIQVLEGTGIDNNSCRVEITRDGNKLKNIQIQGAAEVWEIMAENNDGYGPRRHINPNGGEEVILKSPGIFKHFSHSENFFSDGEVFSLDTNDIVSTEDGTGGLKMLIKVALNYENGELVSVQVTNKAKALYVATIASSKFSCEK